jgi:hypothetical protein
MEIPGWTTPPDIDDIKPDRPMGWELLSKEDQDLSDRLSQGRKVQEEIGRVASVTANRLLILAALFFLVDGLKIAQVVHDWITK